MRKILVLSFALAAGVAHADMLEVSGFGGYTTVGMKDFNSAIGKPSPLMNETSTTDISNGYVVGLEVRTGVLIPIPFVSVGLRGEYIGANEGQSEGTLLGQSYDIKYTPSMEDAMLGLSLAVDIPGTGLGLAVGAYGGYGEGEILVSSSGNNNVTVPDAYVGGSFVGEAEARLKYKIYAVLNIYAFGGMRWANLGTFSNAASAKLGGSNASVDFSGATAGGGINLDF